MERPLLTEAPLHWLEAVVTETEEDADEKELAITINSVEDDKPYEFSYVLGEIRTELKRRKDDE